MKNFVANFLALVDFLVDFLVPVVVEMEMENFGMIMSLLGSEYEVLVQVEFSFRLTLSYLSTLFPFYKKTNIPFTGWPAENCDSGVESNGAWDCVVIDCECGDCDCDCDCWL